MLEIGVQVTDKCGREIRDSGRETEEQWNSAIGQGIRGTMDRVLGIEYR